MVRALCLTATIFLVAFILPGVSQAEKAGFCVTTQEAMDAVRSEKEQLVFRGISKRGHLVTIYLSKKSQTFTALIRYKDGRSCFVDFGTSGQILPIDGDPV